MLKRLAALLVGAFALAALLLYSQRTSGPLKVSGFIEADEIRVGSRIGGRVQRVHIEEGQAVHAGQLLIELEPFQLLEQRAEAEGTLAARRADLERLTAGFRAEEKAEAKARRDQLAAHLEMLVNGPRKQEIAAARAQVDLAQAELELAQVKYDRAESLFAKKAVSREEMDQATRELKVARANTQVRREELAKLLEGTRREEIEEAKAQLEQATQAWQLRVHGYRPEEIAQAKAADDAAQAALAAIGRQIEELQIKAPADGVVEALDLQPGDLVSANTPAVSLMDTRHYWVRAYVPENQLNIQIGRKVQVSVDSFPGQRFAAHISFIARQAEFTPSNIQTPEERSKQVIRIKVTLDEGLDRLRPGMSADVWLESEGARG